MRRIGSSIALAAIVASAGLLVSSASAATATSTVPFTTCSDAPAFGCAHLTVPLDPTGAVPGTVTLAIRRRLAASGTANEAVVALAGGPGQAALPFATDAAQIMSAALGTRDLVIFDQRGTGQSGPLACAAFKNANASISTAVPACADQIGATRGLYTTDDSVYDIEQIRKALGYTKLVLYGTSYGTKVALRYAAEYPANVSGLVLDSPVTPNGPDVFDQTTYQAVPRMLDELCARGACPGIANPVADLESVLARLERNPVEATFYNGSGKRQRFAISAGDIAQVLLGGDEDPVLREDFPAAIDAAAHGHFGLLAILVNHTLVGSSVSNSGVDNPLFFDTECEELPYPWARTAAPASRLTEALAAAKAMPAGSFGPFNAQTAVEASAAPVCAYWPFASAAPETTITSEPDVPTLIINGADDLRTPLANAQAVQAMIPGAALVVVPQTGHSALTTEQFSSCGQNAVNAFFAGTPIQTNCTAKKLPGYLQPAHRAPSSLGSVGPVAGSHGAAGRTAHAVELTIDWTGRELNESLYETLIGSYNPNYNRGLGGLDGGFAKVSTSKSTANVTVSFHGFSYVGGVKISGAFSDDGTGRLVISGGQAASGTLVARKPDDFTGTLGGVHVHFTIANANSSALTATAG
jgi:pimeloyl-ACP methyl ester carboxylesterase